MDPEGAESGKGDHPETGVHVQASLPSSCNASGPDLASSQDNNNVVPFSIQVGLVFFSALYTMLFSGAIFGWGPMQLMLEQDGAFAWKCRDSADAEELPCEAQSVTLVQVQLIATLMAVFSPFMGMFTDRYGALKLMYLLSFLGTSGIALSMVASSTQTHRVHFLAFSLFGLMFVATNILTVQTGLVLPENTQRRVISALNGLLDAGSISYLGLYEIYKATNASFVAVMGGYLGLAIFCFGGAIYYWTALVRVSEESDSAKDEEGHKGETTEPVTQEDEEEVSNTMRDGDKDDLHEVVSDPRDLFVSQKSSTENVGDDGYILIVQRDPWNQLKSKQFILIVCFFSIHLLHNNWTLATARDFLASLGDDEEGNKYTSVFTGLSAASLVGLPIFDMLTSRFGYHAALQAVNLLGILHGIVQVSTDDLNVQVLGFIIYSFYRCFTFSTCFSFLPTFLRGDTVGRGCGVMSFVGSMTSLVNIGLADWAITGLDRDFFVPNLLMLVLVIPAFYIAWVIGTCITQEERSSQLSPSPELLDRSRHAPLMMTEKLIFHYEPAPTISGSTRSSLSPKHTSFRVDRSRPLHGSAAFREEKSSRF